MQGARSGGASADVSIKDPALRNTLHTPGIQKASPLCESAHVVSNARGVQMIADM